MFLNKVIYNVKKDFEWGINSVKGIWPSALIFHECNKIDLNSF